MPWGCHGSGKDDSYGHVYHLKPELAEKVKAAFFNYDWNGSELAKAFNKAEPRYATGDLALKGVQLNLAPQPVYLLRRGVIAVSRTPNEIIVATSANPRCWAWSGPLASA